jgi:hypothetical protein
VICGVVITCIVVLLIVGPFCLIVLGPGFFHWKNTLELRHAVKVKFDTTPPKEVCTTRLTMFEFSASAGFLALRSVGNIRWKCANEDTIRVCDWSLVYPL